MNSITSPSKELVMNERFCQRTLQYSMFILTLRTFCHQYENDFPLWFTDLGSKEVSMKTTLTSILLYLFAMITYFTSRIFLWKFTGSYITLKPSQNDVEDIPVTITASKGCLNMTFYKIQMNVYLHLNRKYDYFTYAVCYNILSCHLFLNS